MTREELLAKIEAATGPDRELDFAICKHLGIIPADAQWCVEDGAVGFLARMSGGWETPAFTAAQAKWKRDMHAFIGSPEYYSGGSGKWMEEHPAPYQNADWRLAPPSGTTPCLTASIDAALGLVERLLPDLSADITRYRNGKGACRLWRSDPTHPGLHITVADSDEQNATMPLAILAALLRALPPSNEAAR